MPLHVRPIWHRSRASAAAGAQLHTPALSKSPRACFPPSLRDQLILTSLPARCNPWPVPGATNYMACLHVTSSPPAVDTPREAQAPTGHRLLCQRRIRTPHIHSRAPIQHRLLSMTSLDPPTARVDSPAQRGRGQTPRRQRRLVFGGHEATVSETGVHAPTVGICVLQTEPQVAAHPGPSLNRTLRRLGLSSTLCRHRAAMAVGPQLPAINQAVPRASAATSSTWL